MKQLDLADQEFLLHIARRSIEASVSRGERLDPSEAIPASVTAPAAAFVTIHERGELRGCIGLMRFEAPLWVNVRDAAAAAALDDPRFLPVAESELPDLELEVSVLEPPVQIPSAADFVAGRHGIVVERDRHHALLLPQVATEMGWTEVQMLDAVCKKANLPHDAWREPTTMLSIFESVCFNEADIATAARTSEPPPAG
jgi:AmmeMemoRadiSam system protein A